MALGRAPRLLAAALTTCWCPSKSVSLKTHLSTQADWYLRRDVQLARGTEYMLGEVDPSAGWTDAGERDYFSGDLSRESAGEEEVMAQDTFVGTLPGEKRSVLPPHLLREANGTRKQPRVAMLSVLGADRLFGCGLRQLAMIADLKECGMSVDVINEKFTTREGFHWDPVTTQTHLGDVEIIHVKDYGTTEADMKVLLSQYDHIYFFAWLWEMWWNHELPIRAVRVIQKNPELKSRVSVIFDDNPHQRCLKEIGLYQDCDKADNFFHKWADIAGRMYTLVEQDAHSIHKYMEKLDVAHPPIQVWPLRMKHLIDTAGRGSPRLYEQKADERVYLTMIAADHPMNMKFVKAMFENKELDKICTAVRKAKEMESSGVVQLDKRSKHPSLSKNLGAVRVLFGGLITKFIKSYILKDKNISTMPNLDCVELRGKVSDDEFKNKIVPRTRAMLNPILEPLNSGISVKTWEAIANGLPVITSKEGLRGLEKCALHHLKEGKFLTANPHVDHLTAFVLSTVMREDRYQGFLESTHAVREACSDYGKLDRQVCTLDPPDERLIFHYDTA